MTQRFSAMMIILAGMALPGVAPASVAQPLTKHALDVRANAACQTASNATARVALGPEPSNAAGWLPRGTTLHAIERTEITALEKLTPPKRLAKLWRTYLLGLHHEERAIEPLSTAPVRTAPERRKRDCSETIGARE
jgi:hypothetical protein